MSNILNPKVMILGCGDAFASGGRFNTCFYLHNQNHHILIDCGASALISLKKFKIPLSKIEYVVLSHLHGDHFGGLPFFLLDAQFNQKREQSLKIIGPYDTEQKVRDLTEILYPGTNTNEFDFSIEFLEYESGIMLTPGPFSLIPYSVIHSKPSNPHGLRIMFQEKIFAFSGDTEWTESLIEISRDADLFICESNYYNKKGPNHLDYFTIMENRNRLSCKKILLNHLGEEMLSKKSELEIECAEDGQIIEL